VTRVLVVDDEPQILRALRINLRARQYDVYVAQSGTEALREAAQHPPDLIILDLGLPDLDGVEVIAGLRGWTDAPIIVLSGRADSADKVEALDAGADDYVTKPFGMDELLARMRAAARRSVGEASEPRVRLGDLVVDLAAKRVIRDRPARNTGPAKAAANVGTAGAANIGAAEAANVGAAEVPQAGAAGVGTDRTMGTWPAESTRSAVAPDTARASQAADTATTAGPAKAGASPGAAGASPGAAGGRAADIRLTPTEWHLLEVLLRHPGKLLSQRQLLNDVWGPGYADATGNLRLYMAQLRRKLEPDPARPRWLLTEPGMGYRFQPDADEG